MDNDIAIWLTIPEAATLVNRAEFTVRRWCNERILPPGIAFQPRGPNSPWMIDPIALEKWVRSGCIAPDPSKGDAA